MWLALALLLTPCCISDSSTSTPEIDELGLSAALIDTWDEVQLTSAITYLQAQQRLRFPKVWQRESERLSVERVQRGSAYLVQAHNLLVGVRRGLSVFSRRRLRADAWSALTAHETAQFDRDLRKAMHSLAAAATLTTDDEMSHDAAHENATTATIPWFETLETMIDIVLLIAEVRSAGVEADGTGGWAPPLGPAAIVSFANTLCARTKPRELAEKVASTLNGSPFEAGLRCYAGEPKIDSTIKATHKTPTTTTERELLVNSPRIQTSAQLNIENFSLRLSTHKLWPTLVSLGRLELPHSSSQDLPAAFMRRLNHAALAGYKKFLSSDAFMKTRDDERCDPSASRFLETSCARKSNHLFYNWQQQAQPSLRLSLTATDLRQLEDILTTVCGSHIERSSALSEPVGSITNAPFQPDRANLRVQIWATVIGGIAGENTSREPHHEDHVHHGAVCSGSFYTQVPNVTSGSTGAAPIVFSDPRGTSTDNLYGDGVVDGLAEPPFIGKRAFFPTAGDILIFPPWLVHSVGSQHSADGVQETRERISWSFNVYASDVALTAWSPIVV